MNRQKFIEMIQTMPLEELTLIMKTALDESNIPWTDEPGGILFDGLPSIL